MKIPRIYYIYVKYGRNLVFITGTFCDKAKVNKTGPPWIPVGISEGINRRDAILRLLPRRFEIKKED